MTPMQKQYNEVKQQHPDDIVLFRLGDFYEAFYADAETLSRVLGITLTGRGKGEERIPMAGVPHHSVGNYLPKLVEAGYKVVMVEQTTDPEPGKLVEREVSMVYTPGTIVDEEILTNSRNNNIVAISKGYETIGLCVADISVGKIELVELEDIKSVLRELSRIEPAEIIIADESIKSYLGDYHLTVVSNITEKEAYLNCVTHFHTSSLKGFGVEKMKTAIVACALLLNYLATCHRRALNHLATMGVYDLQSHMLLDISTIRNLELVSSQYGEGVTVFETINRCKTNMGMRKLRNWLLYPLVDQRQLESRWEAVAELVEKSISLSIIRKLLAEVSDIERITARLGAGRVSPKELISLAASLSFIQDILQQDECKDLTANRIRHIYHQIDQSSGIKRVVSIIGSAISEEPSSNITEGGVIASGYNEQVDYLRSLKTNSKQKLAQIQMQESSATGISSLKVGFNKVFGYYIEVTKTHSDKVPDHYIRKQTLTNAERYITEELKNLEDEILSAQEKLLELEGSLYQEVIIKLTIHINELLHVANLVAELDVLANFAHIAREYRYCRPEISEYIEMSEGRHPVVEQIESEFSPNDISLNDGEFIILTGPNMSGKSTFIRQIALLVLLAQTGSFVPAAGFKFSICDRIFTRVGASDNLSKGESTFMVEMNEVANIVNNASENSLVILDEVGRGTSTYDGVAIAWALSEYVENQISCKTIFATHYHELTELSDLSDKFINYFVQVDDSGKKVVFTHKISPGAASKSYGVHVAQMAGLPDSIISRANDILSNFESGKPKADNSAKQTHLKSKSKSKISPTTPRKIHPNQQELF